jgi:nitrite reductase (NADH) small subunit
VANAVRVCRSDELAEGKGRVVDAGARRVAVFRCDGVVLAVDGVCPHRGGPLAEGAVAGGVVTCPWHGWRIDLRTGATVAPAGKSVARFPAREDGGEIFVEV